MGLSSKNVSLCGFFKSYIKVLCREKREGEHPGYSMATLAAQDTTTMDAAAAERDGADATIRDADAGRNAADDDAFVYDDKERDGIAALRERLQPFVKAYPDASHHLCEENGEMLLIYSNLAENLGL